MASLPALPPAELPQREPDSLPVYAPAPDADAPDHPPHAPVQASDAPAEVPGVSTEPLPGAGHDLMPAGSLGVFVPTLQPAVDREAEPDLEEHPTPPAGPARAPKPRHKTARPLPPPLPLVAVPLPVSPPPPVEYRWQTMLARIRPVADWRQTVFTGQ